MTREEAIKIIDCYDIGFFDLSGEKIPADKLADAFDMAIEALQADAEPTETSTLGEKHQLSHGRLIDADELKKHLDSAWEELNDDGERKGVRLARWYLISAPTVDSTIDVVRCKDCRHRDLFSCPLTDNDFQKDEDFCSWGERKGGDR